MGETILKMTIYGNPITKKNSQRIVKLKGRLAVIPSAAYKKFEKDFVEQCKIWGAYGKNLDERLEVKVLYYMPTRRRVDLTNLLEATDDALQKAGVIVDDCCKVICSHDGSRVLYDKGNPRTEIEIRKFEPEGDQNCLL